MEEIKCQKNITFMSTDKGLKSASIYIKSTGEKKKVICQMLGWVDFSAYFLYLNFFELDILPDSIYLKPDKYFY